MVIMQIVETLIIKILPLFVAIVLHEMSHAFVAYMLGDDTAKKAGRFKLHTHFDLFGSFIIPFTLYMFNSPFLIGYAKPVPVNNRKFKHPEEGMALVAIAGPLCNALLAAISVYILKASGCTDMLFLQFMIGFIALNIALCLFNLIPIPPLDGSRILVLALPKKAVNFMYKIEPYGFIILLSLEMITRKISEITGCNIGISHSIVKIVTSIMTGVCKSIS